MATATSLVNLGYCSLSLRGHCHALRVSSHCSQFPEAYMNADDFKGASRAKGFAKVLKVSSKIVQFIEVLVFIIHYSSILKNNLFLNDVRI